MSVRRIGIVKTALVIGIAFASTGLSGCDASKGDLQNADALSQAFGVPVLLWAERDDVCAQQQFQKLADEYNAADGAEQSVVAGEAKRYRSIIFNGSQHIRPLTGTFYTLQYVQYAQDSQVSQVAQQQVIEDSRDFTSLVGTTVQRAQDLVITPQSAPDLSTTRIYRTDDLALFNLVVQNGPRYLENAAADGKLQDVTPKHDGTPVNCGNQIDLKDLL